MKKLSLFNGINILLLSTLTTLTTVKPAHSLDFTFSFGGITGTVTGLSDNTNGQAGIVTIAPADFYNFNTSFNGFSVLNDNIINSNLVPPITVWSGNGPGGVLVFNITNTDPTDFTNQGLASLGGSSFAPVTFTPVATTTPTSVIPFKFSTTPGLIVLGGISGIAHLCRKLKEKKEQNNDKKEQNGD
jgi:hypothetical protein